MYLAFSRPKGSARSLAWCKDLFARNILKGVTTVDRSDAGYPRRIVVRGTNWVGDTVMSLPAVRELRRILPDAEVAYWGPSNITRLIEAAGVADEIITFDGSDGGPLKRPFRIVGKLRRGRFDMAVLLQNAFESAFTAALAGIPRRVGYPTDLRGPLLNMRVALTKEIRRKHQVFYYLGVVGFLEDLYGGDGETADKVPDCSVLLGAKSLDAAARLLAEHGASLRRPIFSLCPGSVNSEAKRWPEDLFAQLADLLIEKEKAQVVFLGAPGEERVVERIRGMMIGAGAVNMAGKADMMTSMAIMNLSRMVISNDTGSAHLAVAASAKALTLFGPTSPGATAPYGPNAHVLAGAAQCAPCRNFRCPLPDHPCMRSIQPEAVLNRARQILSGRIQVRR